MNRAEVEVLKRICARSFAELHDAERKYGKLSGQASTARVRAFTCLDILDEMTGGKWFYRQEIEQMQKKRERGKK